ncbi:MAG: alanine racemase [Verrucomicrobia subdivision 3 bacterium]|nr:alanine racemase [Limisphaerales bacterium]
MRQYRCWAEIDLDALRENLAWIRHRVGPNVKIMTVVKADAYGHGLKQIAALLMQSGTDVFGVANLAEAQAIRSVGRGWPILMLGACLPFEAETAVREDVMATVSTYDEARRFSEAASRLGRPADIHIKVDTGMGRLGATPHEVLDLWKRLEGLPGLRIRGFYTHFASAEDDPSFTRAQKLRFRRLLAKAPHQSLDYLHANNSAALLFEQDTHLNTVRPGLLVYGILPEGNRRIRSELQHQVRPALSWKCRVSLVKEITRGTALSYGRSFVAPRPMRVATLTAGYGDGYLRAGSNRARVLIGGEYCRVLGRITMDQTIIDVSRLPQVQSGDEAVLIGRQGSRQITVNQLAGWCRTIPWEILTAITARVPRIYTGSQAS